jgi:hypothetical protein
LKFVHFNQKKTVRIRPIRLIRSPIVSSLSKLQPAKLV